MHQPKLCYIIYRSCLITWPSTKSLTTHTLFMDPQVHPWFCHIKVGNANKVGTAFHKCSCKGVVSKAKQEKSHALCIHLHVLFCSLELYSHGDSEPASASATPAQDRSFSTCIVVQLPRCPLHHLKLPLCPDCWH